MDFPSPVDVNSKANNISDEMILSVGLQLNKLLYIWENHFELVFC